MATTFKVLGQAGPANTSTADLYTVGSGKSAVVSSLTISNVSAAAANATVYVRVAGATAVDANALLKTVSIGANSVVSLTLGLTLAAADVVTIQSSVASALTFMAFGQENS